MQYIISENAKFGSVEIKFSAKPDEATRDALKALKFRWNGKRGLWYGFATVEAVKAALSGEKAQGEANSTGAERKPKAAKIDKDALRAEFAKAWNSPKMIDYCVGKVAAVAVLPSGEIVTVEKKSIETRFCFGERGYDYDDAQKAARHAAQSESYFKAENMRAFNEAVKDLEDAQTMNGPYILTINGGAYIGQTEDCKLRSINFQRVSNVLADLGGSAFLAEIPGQTVTERGSGRAYRIATAEEIAAILDAYKTARAAHEKKVDAYLKRYGMSKVETWTYWIDA